MRVSRKLESGSYSVISRISGRRPIPRLTSMTEELPPQRVEVSFVGAPPLRELERASGVSDLEIDGRVVRCLARGIFQPFLEALRGHEVITFESEATDAADSR